MSLQISRLALRLRWFQVNPIIGNFRTVKTTATEHPKPIYDQEEKFLEKVIQEREQDLATVTSSVPMTMKNPYEKPKRQCILCKHKIVPNYKNIKLLYQFVSPYTGMAYGRHVTGLCKKMQEKVELEINIASKFGLMASYLKEPEFIRDPKLCDPERLVRPHKY